MVVVLGFSVEVLGFALHVTAMMRRTVFDSGEGRWKVMTVEGER